MSLPWAAGGCVGKSFSVDASQLSTGYRHWQVLEQLKLFCVEFHIQAPWRPKIPPTNIVQKAVNKPFILRRSKKKVKRRIWLLYTFEDFALLRRFSGKVNEVPTLLRMVGNASPGLRGYSGGSWPLSAPSSKHNFLSSSILALSFSSIAAFRDFSAETISMRAALAASLSSASARGKINVKNAVVIVISREKCSRVTYPVSVPFCRWGLAYYQSDWD